jgi:hypothetical protein
MPGTSVISLSEEPMNQAIFLANSVLKSCIDRTVGGAAKCLLFIFIPFVFQSRA